jgi:hypothetical protein
MISLDFPVKKAVYSKRYDTLYMLNGNKNEIVIYKDKQYFNKIGGSGFSENSFRKLADICLTNDGNLLALDSFDKVVRKFDRNGLYVSSVPVSEIKDPMLVEMNENGYLFIYDNSGKEIYVYDNTALKFLYTFGKTYFNNIDRLSVSNSRVICYEKTVNKSYIFTLNGYLEKTLDNFALTENGNNILLFSNGLLNSKDKQNLLNDTIDQNSEIFIKNNCAILSGKGYISVYEFYYY